MDFFSPQISNNKNNYEILVSAIKSSKKGKTLGIFSDSNDNQNEFIQLWKAALTEKNFEEVSIIVFPFALTIFFNFEI